MGGDTTPPSSQADLAQPEKLANLPKSGRAAAVGLSGSEEAVS